MKKANRIIGMMFLAAALVVTASCKKDNTKQVSSLDLTLPAVEGNPALDGDKAYIDMVASQMKWYDGDKVRLYSIDEDYTKSKTAVYESQVSLTGELVGHFTGTPLAQGSVGYFVFYPFDKADFSVGDTQNCTTDLYQGTSYEGRIFMDPRGVVAAITTDAQVNGTMKHIFGFANVRLKDTSASGKKVKSVAITDNYRHLTGSISFKIPQLTFPILNGMKTLGQNYKAGSVNADTYAATLNDYLQQIGYMSNSEGYTVTLNCTENPEITSSGYKFFMIPLRPGALLRNFTITVTYSDNSHEDFIVPADKKYIIIPGTYTNISINLASGVI